MSHEFPFEGLRVVDASQGIAGPTAAMLLAQYGADVIKVEPREGDWSRSIGSGKAGMTSLSLATNPGKRSIALDLKHPAGAAIMRRLAERADVFIENFRTGVMERLGFSYRQVTVYNPRVVYLSVTGFGQVGPLRQQPATDSIMQAFTGMMGVNRGREDGLPHRLECWPIDVASGLCAFQALSVALYGRRESGRGRYIDASLLQGAVGLQMVRVIEHILSSGAVEGAGAFPQGIFRSRDGYFSVSVLRDSWWPKFCVIVGRPDWAQAPELATVEGRRARASEIVHVLNGVFLTEPSDHWCGKFREASILNERVNTYDDLLEHPQTAATGLYTWVDQAAVGRVPHPNFPGIVPLPPDGERAKVPRIGAHTRAVLTELGYGEDAIERLLASEAVFAASSHE